MNRFLLFLLLPFCALAQTKPWTGNATNAWLTQSPNGVKISQSGANTRVVLNGQSAGAKLIFDSSPGTASTNDNVMTRASTGEYHLSSYSIGDLINGPTLYTGNGTLTGSRQVDGDGFALDFVNMNNVTITPVGTDFIAGSISGSAVNNTRRSTLNAGLVRLNATTNVTINEYTVGSPGLNEAGVIFSSTSNSPASSAEILFRDPTTHVVGWGSAYTAADIGGGGGQNFANANLTADDDRTHDWDGHNLTISGITELSITSSATAGIIGNSDAFIQSGSLYFDVTPSGMTLNTSNGSGDSGQVLTVGDNGAEWADPPSGQNISNADLTSDGSHTLDVNGNNLTIDNGVNFTVNNFETIGLYSNNGSYVEVADTYFYLQGPSSSGSLEISSDDSVTLNSGGSGFQLTTPSGSGLLGQVLTSDGTYADWSDPQFPLNGVPTVAAGAGAGGSPTVALANETDSAFTINVTAGTTPTVLADIAVVTFAAPYATPPHFSLSPGNGPAATLTGAAGVWLTTTTTNLTLNANATGLVATTNYVWEVIVVR